MSFQLYIFPTLRHYKNLGKKIHSTIIYETIFMKIYMNANIVYDTNFLLNEVRPQRSLKATKGYLFLRYIFCV